MAVSARKEQLRALWTKLSNELREQMKFKYTHEITVNVIDTAAAMTLVCAHIIPDSVNTKANWQSVVRGLNNTLTGVLGDQPLKYILSGKKTKYGEILGITNVISAVSLNSDMKITIGRPSYGVNTDKTYSEFFTEYKKSLIVRFYTYFKDSLKNTRIEREVTKKGGLQFKKSGEGINVFAGQLAHTDYQVGQKVFSELSKGKYSDELVEMEKNSPLPYSSKATNLHAQIMSRVQLAHEPVDDIIKLRFVPYGQNPAGGEKGDISSSEVIEALDDIFNKIIQDIRQTNKWPIMGTKVQELKGSNSREEKKRDEGVELIFRPFEQLGIEVKRERQAKKGRSNAVATYKPKPAKKPTVQKKSAKLKQVKTKARNNTRQQSPIALANIINQYLPQTLKSRMVAPALVYRTGRFANSAEVTNIIQGPRGGMTAEYTYMKNPYQTFEPGFRMGSTYRDPRPLISGAIRDIAIQQMGIKFGNIRRV